MADQRYRGFELEAGGWRGPESASAYLGFGVFVVAWPNGKRWDASVDVGGGKSGRDGRGFGKTKQSAIDSAIRSAIRNKKAEIAALQMVIRNA